MGLGRALRRALRNPKKNRAPQAPVMMPSPLGAGAPPVMMPPSPPPVLSALTDAAPAARERSDDRLGL